MHSIDRPMGDASLAGFFRGASLLFEGIRFIRQKRSLWLLSLVPVILTVLGVASSALLFWSQFDWIHASLVGMLPTLEAGEWWSWLWVGPGRLVLWLLGWLGVLASFALALVAGLLAANLASAPFLDQLSQRVEALETGEPAASGGFTTLMRESLGSLASELQRLAFLGAVWIGLSLIGFVIPGAQLITAPLLIALTMLFLPLDYSGFALDRLGVSFRERRSWLMQHRSLMLGFGGVAFVACLVPGLSTLR